MRRSGGVNRSGRKSKSASCRWMVFSLLMQDSAEVSLMQHPFIFIVALKKWVGVFVFRRNTNWIRGGWRQNGSEHNKMQWRRNGEKLG